MALVVIGTVYTDHVAVPALIVAVGLFAAVLVARAPITLGIVLGYLVGRPIGFVGTALLVTRATGGRLRPPVGWAAVAGGGAIAGLGFTLSLLIATVALDGRQLAEAKIGILTAAVAAPLVTSKAPTSAASPAPRPSSSTGAATAAPMTSRPSRPPCAGPRTGHARDHRDRLITQNARCRLIPPAATLPACATRSGSRER